MFVIPPGNFLDINNYVGFRDHFGLKGGETIWKPIKVWMNSFKDIEKESFQQLMNVANLPFIHSHVSQMADGHKGYGMMIGGVIATNGVVIPHAVGKDGGCGMLSFMLINLTIDDIMPRREDIVAEILKRIPTGFDHNKEPLEGKGCISGMIREKVLKQGHINGVQHPKKAEPPVFEKEKERIEYQAATLGGGK